MTNRIVKRSAAFMAIIIAIIMSFAAMSFLVGCDEKEEKQAVTITKLDKTTNTINVNDEFTLKATTSRALEDGEVISWTSDKETVATVDAKGKVKGIAGGEATITASINDSKATCTVTVTDKKELSLSITGATIDLDDEDKTVTIVATCTSNGTAEANANVSWTSSAPEIASVENGVVTGLTAGKATVTATWEGVNATCEVKVVNYITVGYQNDVTDASKWYKFGPNGDSKDGTFSDISKDGNIVLNEAARIDFFRVNKDPADNSVLAPDSDSWKSVVDQVNNCGEKIFGYEYLFNLDLTATGDFCLILGGTKGVTAEFNNANHRAIYLYFTDGKIELKQSGAGGDVVQATANYEGTVADITSVTFSITRISGTEILWGIYVNGTKLDLTGTPTKGELRGGSYYDNFSVNQSNGYGQRLGVVPGEDTTVTISGNSLKRSATN